MCPFRLLVEGLILVWMILPRPYFYIRRHCYVEASRTQFISKMNNAMRDNGCKYAFVIYVGLRLLETFDAKAKFSIVQYARDVNDEAIPPKLGHKQGSPSALCPEKPRQTRPSRVLRFQKKKKTDVLGVYCDIYWWLKNLIGNCRFDVSRLFADFCGLLRVVGFTLTVCASRLLRPGARLHFDAPTTAKS